MSHRSRRRRSRTAASSAPCDPPLLVRSDGMQPRRQPTVDGHADRRDGRLTFGQGGVHVRLLGPGLAPHDLAHQLEVGLAVATTLQLDGALDRLEQPQDRGLGLGAGVGDGIGCLGH